MPTADNGNQTVPEDNPTNQAVAGAGAAAAEPAAPGAAPPENNAAAEPAAAPSGESSVPGGQDTADEPKSLLDAALKALAPAGEGTAKAADAAAKTTAGDQPSDRGAPGEAADQGEPLDGIPHIPDAEFRALPKVARTAINLLRREVANLRPQAQRVAALDRFMQVSGVTAEEFAEGQDVMALMKRDPAEALKRLEGYVARLRHHLGIELPDDLREEVEAGYITEERARELSQARARAAHAERAAQAASEAAAMDAMLADVTAWENATRATDPDFARKLPLVQERVKLKVLERQVAGNPVRTGAEAVQIAREAYAQVNEMMRSFAPAPAATRPSPTSAASAPAAPAAPKDIYEAAWRGLRGAA